MTNMKDTTYMVFATVSYGVEEKIEATSKEHAIKIFKRDWKWDSHPDLDCGDNSLALKIEGAGEYREDE